MSAPALEISGLGFSYAEKQDALADVTLRVDSGEKLGVIGPNGSGKTTLFMLIAGVLRPSSGSILVDGSPVRPGEFDPRVGVLFQDPDDQLFCPSVEEDVAFGPGNMSLAPGEAAERTRSALERFGIGHLAGRPPHHLSGGEKRLVTMAGVAAMRPSLILYDEPEGSLDSRSRRGLISFIRESAETLLIASHDLELVLEVSSRAVILDAGLIVADGPPSEVMSNEELMESHGLEKPHSLVPHQIPHHEIRGHSTYLG